MDVFFVISGYVITGSFGNYADLGGAKALAIFYSGRLRRLAPALVFCVLFFSLLFVLLVPETTKVILQTAGLSLVGLSNILLYSNATNYFGLDGRLNPFTHTWSLAVEEQFYLFYPLFLIFFTRRSRPLLASAQRIIVTLAVATAASYASFVYFSAVQPMAAFYLAPMRFWQISIGCLINLLGARLHGSAGQGWLLGGAAIVLVILLLGHCDGGVVATTLSCGAVAILLAFGSDNGRSLPVRTLTLAPIRFVGRISYSLYLYHWPYFLIFGHTVGHSTITTLLAALLTFPSAVFSREVFEKRWRENLTRHAPRRIIISGAISLVTAMLLIGAVFPVIAKSYSSVLARAIGIKPVESWPVVNCHGAEALKELADPLVSCLGRAPDTRRTVFIVGDSHAAEMTFPFQTLADQHSFAVHFINTESKADFPYAFFTDGPVSGDKVLKQIMMVADRGDILVIAFHRGRLNETRDAQIALDQPVEINDQERNFLSNMRQWLPKLGGIGVKVLLMKDTPLLASVIPVESCAIQAKVYGQNSCRVAFAQDDHTRTRQTRIFNTLQQEFPGDVAVFDPAPSLFSDGQFDPVRPDGSYRMLDWNHLSVTEAKTLAVPIWAMIQRAGFW